MVMEAVYRSRVSRSSDKAIWVCGGYFAIQMVSDLLIGIVSFLSF